MSRTHTTQLTIEFGDCDPAGIVFYPNYFRWMDRATWHYFRALSLADWRQRSDGIFGMPLVDAQARFVAPATYGEDIELDTTIAEWRTKSFVVQHRVRRGEVLLAEGREVRVFARKHPHDPKRIQAVPPPEDVRAACQDSPNHA